MIQVGITGNIGSGKTTAAKVFETIGIPVFQADRTAKALFYDKDVFDQIVHLFGKGVIEPQTKQINKKKIAAIVFNNLEKLEKLNSIIHPKVRIAYQNWIKKHQNRNYVLHEAAILIESGFYKMFDKIILVTAPENIRINRVIARDKLTLEEVNSRIKNQIPESEKIKFADYILNNSGEQLLIPQILHIHGTLNRLANQGKTN